MTGTSVISYCVWGFQNAGPNPLITDIADDLLNIWGTELASIFDTECTMGPFDVLEPFGSGVLTALSSSDDAGTSVWDSMPPNNALLVRKVSSTSGRRGRGRMFLPYSLPDAAVNQVGVIDGTSLGVRQSALNDWLTAMTTADYPLVILHNNASTPSTVTALQVDSMIGVQKRRLGRGQ